jgi:hypothetical protein
MTPTPNTARSLTYLAAINEALAEEMRRDPNVLVMGEDVGGEFGGAFKVTQGLAAEFGPLRVNTPLAELGFTGMAAGMALMGLRPVVEMQFADFISTAFDSIVQFAATAHYRWGGAVPLVIRAPSDGGLRAGPFHSQNPEAWFVHAPGLKGVAPATPADAKGLLIAAIRDNNPVIYFESKLLYRSLKGDVPTGEYVVPIGRAQLARRGDGDRPRSAEHLRRGGEPGWPGPRAGLAVGHHRHGCVPHSPGRAHVPHAAAGDGNLRQRRAGCALRPGPLVGQRIQPHRRGQRMAQAGVLLAEVRDQAGVKGSESAKKRRSEGY